MGPATFERGSARRECRRGYLIAWLVLAATLPLAPAYADDMPLGLPRMGERPPAEDGITKLSVGIWVGDITHIDSVAQTFSANLALVLRWKDRRLAHSEAGMKEYDLAGIWYPRWIIANEIGGLERSLPEKVEVAPDGSAIYRQRLVGSFAQGLDLRAFPFDHDTFRIHLIVGGYRPQEIEFLPDPCSRPQDFRMRPGSHLR
jgi:hypothetical protein